LQFTQQAILSFFAAQGRQNSPISVKFGTAEVARQISRSSVNIWGFSAQKTRKFAKISNFFAPQGRTSCPMSMKSVGFMRVIGLKKLLTFGAIRLVN